MNRLKKWMVVNDSHTFDYFKDVLIDDIDTRRLRARSCTSALFGSVCEFSYWRYGPGGRLQLDDAILYGTWRSLGWAQRVQGRLRLLDLGLQCFRFRGFGVRGITSTFLSHLWVNRIRKDPHHTTLAPPGTFKKDGKGSDLQPNHGLFPRLSHDVYEIAASKKAILTM